MRAAVIVLRIIGGILTAIGCLFAVFGSLFLGLIILLVGLFILFTLKTNKVKAGLLYGLEKSLT